MMKESIILLSLMSLVLINSCSTCPNDCRYVECLGAYCDNGECKCPVIEPVGVKECTTDDDCVIGGCSGTVCQSKNTEPIFTTCEYLPEYACYKQIDCKCINEKCQWDNTEEFDKCVEEARKSGGEAVG